jgi:hypothetical protein
MCFGRVNILCMPMQQMASFLILVMCAACTFLLSCMRRRPQRDILYRSCVCADRAPSEMYAMRLARSNFIGLWWVVQEPYIFNNIQKMRWREYWKTSSRCDIYIYMQSWLIAQCLCSMCIHLFYEKVTLRHTIKKKYCKSTQAYRKFY